MKKHKRIKKLERLVESLMVRLDALVVRMNRHEAVIGLNDPIGPGVLVDTPLEDELVEDPACDRSLWAAIRRWLNEDPDIEKDILESYENPADWGERPAAGCQSRPKSV